MQFRIYNSRSQQIEPLRPLRGRLVRMYACGPTVYDYAHIGNLRSYLFEDIVKRVLLMNGFRVQHVMNVTDVGHLTDDADSGDDKLELAAGKQQKTAKQLAAFYTKAFVRDLRRLNILKPDAMPRATEFIAEQIAFVQRLMERGFAYVTTDGVYFDTEKFPSYGRAFGGQALEEKEAGARVAVRAVKRHPQDFALWKLTPPKVQRQQEWESPWGRGFPGWHIECSVMGRELLGQPFDIHCGGIDHIPVHHTNEIAQSEVAYDAPLASMWCHGAFLTVDGGRMGKSEGNLITVDALVDRGYEPLAYRYLALGAHYRSPLNFTWESLDAAQSALDHLRERCRELPKAPARVNAALAAGVRDVTHEFLSACSDDLNTPQALAIFWDAMKSKRDPRELSAIIAYADRVLGLGLAGALGKPIRIPSAVAKLVSERERARDRRDWARADVLRAQIEALGYLVEDGKDKPKVRHVLRRGGTGTQ